MVYGNSLQNQYVLDDYVVFVNHAHVQKGVSGIHKILTTNYLHGIKGFNDGLYRPMSQVSFAIEKSLYDLNPKLMHFWNVLIYALAIAILFAFLKRLFHQHSKSIVLLICLLFLVHPLHTEITANLKGRDELFAFMGFVVAAFSAIVYFEKQQIKFLLLSGIGFLFALFSKENAVVFLAFIPSLLMIKYPLNKSKTWIHLIGSYLFLTIIFLSVRHWVLSQLPNEVDQGIFAILNNPIAATDENTLKWGSTFALQLLFIKKLFYPFPLMHDYSFNALPLVAINSAQSIIGILILLSLLTLSILALLRRNVWALIASSYFISISVMSQILLPIGTHFAERLLFISVLPISILIVLGIQHIAKTKLNQSDLKANKTTLYICSVLIIFFAFKSFERSKEWKDNLSLYSADVIKDSQSARVNYNYGSELSQQADLISDQSKKIQLLNTSIHHLERAISIYPGYKDAYNNLGLAYKKGRNYQKAIQTYLTAIKRDPNYSKSYYNLATTYFEIKKYKECIAYMQNYVNLKPNAFNAFYIMGQAAGHMNDFENASHYLEQALNINPQFVSAMNFLAMARGMLGQHEVAESILNQALSIEPNNIQLLMNLSINYYQQQEFDKERQVLQRILQIDPNNQAAKSRLK